ncbi:hypothetical protein FXO38_32993 [Capsicum annuum]|uniref:Protein FAR1-RELATED SEQUENCE n=1 Tax=Capsicum annuum TaxID=4072 RepID=A0A2G2YLC4_CAPAN|nr:hypothetical protein FXO38_32993 [Capsicum annuum]PHT70546.1 hypothetical protein T459_25650 [Capsicum annuum]
MMSTQRYESMHAFFDGYISGRSSQKQFVKQYEVALRFKYEKEMESQTSARKQLVRPTTAFDWDMQIYDHYTHAIYDFFRVHVARLPHCEIERHDDFDAVEGVELELQLVSCNNDGDPTAVEQGSNVDAQSDDENEGGSTIVEAVEVEGEEGRKSPT